MQFALYGLLTGCVYGLWAMSFSLIYRTVRIFHVLHAATFILAAYACWAMQAYLGAPFPAAAAIALLLATLVGVASEVLLYRPMLRAGVPPALLFVTSLGAYIAIENLIQLIWRANVRTIPVPDSLSVYLEIGDVGVAGIELTEAGIALALWLLTFALLRYTMIGKAVRALSVAPEMAELAGIDIWRIRTAVFAYGSLLMGIAGILFLAKLGIEPSSGLPVWIVAVVASLIVRANPMLAFLAAVVIGFAESFALIWLPSRWQPAIPVVILLLYLLGEAAWRQVQDWRLRRETQLLVRND